MDYSDKDLPLFKSDTLALLLTALFFAYISANVMGGLMLVCALSYLLVSVVGYAFRSRDRIERLVTILFLTIIGVAIGLFVVIPTVMFVIRRAQGTTSGFAQ